MIRLAVSEDLDQVMLIINAVVTEMQCNGNTQWDETYPRITDFQKDIESLELYVAEIDGQIAGFICINRLEPEEYAGADWSRNTKPLVLHRMSVHPDRRHQGIGSMLMKHAEELARSRGVNYIRSDTYSLNPKMNALFQKLNYRFTGEIHFMRKTHPFNCYEKILERKNGPC
jgi:GNAT superfamily N-acetyltransferase